MAEKNVEKLKKSAAALAASAGILLGGLFNSPSGLPQDFVDRAPPPAVGFVLPDLPEDSSDDDLALPEEEKKKKSSFSLWFSSRKLWVRLCISLGIVLIILSLLWCAYSFLCVSLPAFFRALAAAVFSIIALLTAYSGVAKAVLPGTPLKKLLSPKVLLFTAGGTVLIFLLIHFLKAFLFS